MGCYTLLCCYSVFVQAIGQLYDDSGFKKGLASLGLSWCYVMCGAHRKGRDIKCHGDTYVLAYRSGAGTFTYPLSDHDEETHASETTQAG